MNATICRAALVFTLAIAAPTLHAAQYVVDESHSFVEFRIKHLGFSWLYGRFNNVTGSFTHDAGQPQNNRIAITIDTASVDSNHAERDKHLRSDDFLDVDKYPTATFKSTGYEGTAQEGTLHGDLTLHGVTRPISIKLTKHGEGKDPWGGYRAGFSGALMLDRRDFGIDKNLGPTSWMLEMDLGIEGIRQ